MISCIFSWIKGFYFQMKICSTFCRLDWTAHRNCIYYFRRRSWQAKLYGNGFHSLFSQRSDIKYLWVPRCTRGSNKSNFQNYVQQLLRHRSVFCSLLLPVNAFLFHIFVVEKIVTCVCLDVFGGSHDIEFLSPILMAMGRTWKRNRWNHCNGRMPKPICNNMKQKPHWS